MVESVDDPPVTLGHSKWITAVPRTTRVNAPGRDLDARQSMLAAFDFTLPYYSFATDRAGFGPKAVAQQRPLPDGPVASRTFIITPMPYHLLSYYRFRMGA
jgi:hypothetical protein